MSPSEEMKARKGKELVSKISSALWVDKGCLREISTPFDPILGESVVMLKGVGSGSALARASGLTEAHSIKLSISSSLSVTQRSVARTTRPLPSLPSARSRSERSTCGYITFPMKHTTRGRRRATLTRSVGTERAIPWLDKLAAEADRRPTRLV